MPQPDVEEGRYSSGYFCLGTLVGQDIGREQPMIGITYVNAKR